MWLAEKYQETKVKNNTENSKTFSAKDTEELLVSENISLTNFR
jgi:hypothetical protein